MENDDINNMVLGAIWCEENKRKIIIEEIKKLKEEYGLSRGNVTDLKSLLWLLSRKMYTNIEIHHTFADTVRLFKYYIINVLQLNTKKTI